MANRQDIIETVASDPNVDVTKKDAGIIVNSVLGAIQGSLADEGQVQLAGFGTFTVNERKARKGVNPQTMEEIDIGPVNVIGFRAGQGLKDAVNPGR